MKLYYCLLVTGPSYGTQQASTAYQFSLSLLMRRHCILSIFFYCDGVLNANKLITPAADEFDLVRAWVNLSKKYDIMLNVCISSAMRRGIIDEEEASKQNILASNLQPGFLLGGLGVFTEVLIKSDRIVQF
ncbi:Sulfurtransferase TusD [Candidatus Ecksteinia adelgidicola]|nr:Sulfurtransferase TusD [Candidatus Ecksteinia adelgidicola]